MMRQRWVSGVWRRGFFDARAVEQAITGVAVLVFIAAVLFVVIQLIGCKPVEDPTAHRRAVVLTIANGVYVADQACASIARGKTDAREGYELARACAFAYDAARVSLIAADEKLNMDQPDDVSCEVAQALAYAKQIAGLIEKHGGKLPPALRHAFELAPMLAENCAG
jgi:hypothetical protein